MKTVFSRRATLRMSALGLAGVAMKGLALDGNEAKTILSGGGRIDTHHHFLPAGYVEAYGPDKLAAATPSGQLPSWSLERALAMSEKYQISEAILSISPGFSTIDEKKRSSLIRDCNEIGAGIQRDYPGRFGHFASLEMENPTGALKEIEHALDFLNADGFVVFSNYQGRYLGDPAFSEIWQELDRRKAVVFIHPTSPNYKLVNQPSESVLEFTFDTTRTATSLIYSGATQRYGNIKFILSHAGGTLPFLASRVAGGAMFNPKVREIVADPMAEVRKFWFDTALSGSGASLAALMQIADPKKVLFGSDFPFAPDMAIGMNAKGVDIFPMDESIRADILRGNAGRLLGRGA